MKTSREVSADKLRGGFYSPDSLVKVCLDRVQSLLTDSGTLRFLEPSAGDGAFLRGLAAHTLAERTSEITAVEIVESAASSCRERLDRTRTRGEVIHDSALAWALENNRAYDVAIGNPPFVRFQFVDERERFLAEALADKFGFELRGVSNLWIPVLISAVGALRPGGAFSFIVPAESFTGVSGHEAREWLLDRVDALYVDVFMPGSFPNVLQEVVVLSGQVLAGGRGATRDMHFRERGAATTREWTHRAVGVSRTWTRFLLSADQIGHLEAATALESVVPLGSVARFEVATVTGANGFFCVAEETVERFGMREWARPLLPRTRYARGLGYFEEDHKQVLADGYPGNLLDFSLEQSDPAGLPGPSSYLAFGESLTLQSRFKCRIRSPWWRVPVVSPGQLMMAKRSHHYPRVIVNEAQVTTTDTIYRGRLLPAAALTAREFAAGFHNSLTLLTAEIEGRSFGGGVLELVPSEVSRLSVPLANHIGAEFERLDWVCRSCGDDEPQVLVEETDLLVATRIPGLDKRLLENLRDARAVLAGLRMARN